MSWTDAICLSADDLRKRGMACILLWMGGGPSQFETFSPKPGHENGGETKAIATSVSGHPDRRESAESRRRDERPGHHPLDDEQGRQPPAGQLPAAPRLLADGRREVSDARLARGPADRRSRRSTCRASCASAAGGADSGGGGFLGRRLRSVRAAEPGAAAGEHAAGHARRSATRAGCELLDQLEADFGAVEGADIVADHRKLIRKSSEMILSPQDGGVRPGQGVGQDARRLRPHARSAPAACWPGGWSKRASRSSR